MTDIPFDPAAPFALFDDSASLPHEARCQLYWDIEETVICTSPDGLEETFSRIEAASALGLHVALVAKYELGYWLEPGVFDITPIAESPLLTALAFRRGVILNGRSIVEWLLRHKKESPSGIAAMEAGIAETDYLEAIQRILGYIRAGDCYQVNFTFPLRFEHYGDPIALYAKLRAAQPVRHGAFIRLPDRDLLSLSPELFVQRRGDMLTTRPMKGTAARDSDPTIDAARRDDLRSSEKNRAENLMIVDLIRNDLGRIAATGKVSVPELFTIEPYPTVWQMTSTVVAEAPHVPLETLFRALFPCGSVTGAPKLRAMQIAVELEPARRGVYTGAIGWLRPDGDFGFNVPIRTLDLARDGRGTIGIGSGIVADSVPADEYAECFLKARFLTNLGADFDLIETLLLTPQDTSPYPLIEDHLARLAASAAYFGFRCNIAHMKDVLLAHARACTEPRRRRVRLLLAKDGSAHIESLLLEDEASLPGLVVLAEGRVDSSDPLRRHKTTARQFFDIEWASRADSKAIFDIVFCNERGELCEGSRCNLFLEFEGVLHTPPLAAGLLDGVMRRKLLRDSPVPIVERALRPEELLGANAIYVSNAVRGLRRVRLDAARPSALDKALLAA